MKKIICFIMICTIILLPLQVEALELEETNKQEVIVGTLVSDDGSIEQVSGHLINTRAFSSINDKSDTLESTYAFDLYSRANNTLTTEEMDGSYSVRVYLTIEYTTQNTPTEYLLTNVSGYWEILDSLVSVTDAELIHQLCSANCYGAFGDMVYEMDKPYLYNNFHIFGTNYIYSFSGRG